MRDLHRNIGLHRKNVGQISVRLWVELVPLTTKSSSRRSLHNTYTET